MSRVPEKDSKRAMSGTLLTFGKVFSSSGSAKSLSIGQFSNEIVRFGKGVDALKRSTYYFVPEGVSAGGGRLTKAMATSAIIYIRKMIAGDRAGYKGPTLAPLSDHYREWKNKIPKFRGKPVMSLTGATADALGVLRYSGGGVTIGVRSNFFVNPTGGPDGRKNRVRVRDYALTHEIGHAKVPHRPIITGSMASWIGETSDDWYEAFTRMMYETFWAELKDRDENEVEESYTDGGSGVSTTQIAADMVQFAEYTENASKKISSFAQKLVTMTARGAKEISQKQEQIVRRTLRAELTGGGLTAQEVEEIINTALTGRMPNFKHYRDS
jgi:hypothetical protein